MSASATEKERWPVVAFGDVVRNVKVNVDREEHAFERFIAGGHMQTEDLHIREWGEFGNDYVGPAFHRQFLEGQVLYGSRRTYLKKVAVAPFDGITANTTFVLETRDEAVLLQELLPFLMHTDAFTEHAVRESKGSTNPYVNWPDIAKFRFPLPPPDEQRRIARLLWAADEAMEAWLGVVHAAEVEHQSVRERELGSPDLTTRPAKEFICDIFAGNSLKAVNEEASSDEFGVLKVSAVGKKGFVPSENKRLLDQSEFHESAAVEEDDLLITRANTPDLVGRVCLTRAAHPNLMLCDKTLRIVPSDQVIDKVVLLEALRTNRVRRRIKGLASGTGGAMKNISQRDIRSLPITIPDRAQQTRIAPLFKRLAAVVEEARQHQKQSCRFMQVLREELLGPRSGGSS